VLICDAATRIDSSISSCKFTGSDIRARPCDLCRLELTRYKALKIASGLVSPIACATAPEASWVVRTEI
jgi:hypothetical protein